MHIRIVFLCTIALAISGLQSCITRTETDIYTLTARDTTVHETVKNTPGDRDNGIIYPSSRTIETVRHTTTRDSVVNRYYPDFIRLGLLETAGLVGTGAGRNGIGTGLFGVLGLIDNDFGLDVSDTKTKTRDVVFTGGIYRIGIIEWRLRWFRDAKNWTYGITGLELLAPEAASKKMLAGLSAFQLRKRYFLREEIPYIAITPMMSLGLYPSQYLNLGASFDVGSIAGLNMRAYAGYATGMNTANSPLNNSKTASFSSFPYVGLGVSFLDFLNIVPETYKEWKDHEHSGWDIGFLQMGAIGSSGKSIFASDSLKNQIFITGVVVKLLNAAVALPVLDYKLYAGTSLLNAVVLSDTKFGVGILPIRIGYWQTLLSDELSVEPFVEYNYYPSSFVHLGGKLNLFLSERMNISLLAGFAAGNTTNAISSSIKDQIGNPTSFSGGYIGIGFGLLDRIFFPEQLRYNRK